MKKMNYWTNERAKPEESTDPLENSQQLDGKHN